MFDTATNEPERIRHYFVDEAGDPVIFGRRKKVVVGTEGCSRFFILGLLDIPAPISLSNDLALLRSKILDDPYLAGIPSLRPEANKTAVAFHAKDDVPEVRQEVFKILMQHEVKFFAVVRNKQSVVAYVRQRNEVDLGYRYNPNELYEYLGRRLFRDRLHKDDGYIVNFARRGSADRTRALGEAALHGARVNYEKKHGVRGEAPIKVIASSPKKSGGLQAVDYFLWALQRLYERGEERYLKFVWPSVSLIHDLDDTRQANYGVYYTQNNPLTAESLIK